MENLSVGSFQKRQLQNYVASALASKKKEDTSNVSVNAKVQLHDKNKKTKT